MVPNNHNNNNNYGSDNITDDKNEIIKITAECKWVDERQPDKYTCVYECIVSMYVHVYVGVRVIE